MAAWMFRPFGQDSRDLDVNFGEASQPHVVTELLCCCTTSGATYEKAWRLTVSRRTTMLLQIGLLSGIDMLHVIRTCKNDVCDERLEIDLSVAALAELQNAAAEQSSLPITLGVREIRCRLPTGSDQLAWQQSSFRDRHEVIEEMARSLIIEADSPEDRFTTLREYHIDTIGRALEAADPLVGLTVDIDCPSCAEPDSYLVDVQQLMLARLEHRQRRLFREVHEMAWHYNWPEDRILALTSQRRRRYLDLIDRQRIA